VRAFHTISACPEKPLRTKDQQPTGQGALDVAHLCVCYGVLVLSHWFTCGLCQVRVRLCQRSPTPLVATHQRVRYALVPDFISPLHRQVDYRSDLLDMLEGVVDADPSLIRQDRVQTAATPATDESRSSRTTARN
jgi:hypothetical protein